MLHPNGHWPEYESPRPPVIPAQAGIQGRDVWILAFARMTPPGGMSFLPIISYYVRISVLKSPNFEAIGWSKLVKWESQESCRPFVLFIGRIIQLYLGDCL